LLAFSSATIRELEAENRVKINISSDSSMVSFKIGTDMVLVDVDPTAQRQTTINCSVIYYLTKTVLFVTKKPDIVFEINGKKFAIEIETGSYFSKISRMKEKLKVLENYNKWFSL